MTLGIIYGSHYHHYYYILLFLTTIDAIATECDCCAKRIIYNRKRQGKITRKKKVMEFIEGVSDTKKKCAMTSHAR